MKTHIAILLLLSVPFAAADADCTHVARLTSPGSDRTVTGNSVVPYPDIDPARVIKVYLEAVGRGELRIFDKPVTRSMLKPERVEYVYTLDSRLPRVSVFSTLTVSLPFPDMPDLQVEGVTGFLDWKGRITDSTIHCQPGIPG
ncbi:MAG: hypothetical protein AB1560_10585 [Pseudomonadota bacterium]